MLPSIRVNNGTTSVITAPAPTTHVGAFCGFFKVSVDTNAFTSVFQVREGGGNDGDQLSCGSTGTDLLWIDYPTTGEIAVANLDVGRWYFVAGNRRSTSIEIYLATPGSPGWITRVFNAGAGTFTPNAMSWGVWSGSGVGDTMDGCFAGWRYWVGRALSGAEFWREGQSMRAVSRAGLWGEWWFSGTPDIRDRSGRNNHASLGAGTITSEPGPLGVLPRRRRRVTGGVTSGGLTGSIAITGSAGAVAMAGGQILHGSLGITGGTGVVAMAGQAKNHGDLVITGSAGTVAMAGQALNHGAMAIAGGSGVVAMSGGSGTFGDLVIAGGSGVVAMEGEPVAHGTLGITSSAGVVAMEGEPVASGDLVITGSAGTVAMAGQAQNHGDLVITGSAGQVAMREEDGDDEADDFFLTQ